MPSSRGSSQPRDRTSAKLFSTVITPFCQLLKKKQQQQKTHPSECEVVSQCGYYMHFLND